MSIFIYLIHIWVIYRVKINKVWSKFKFNLLIENLYQSTSSAKNFSIFLDFLIIPTSNSLTKVQVLKIKFQCTSFQFSIYLMAFIVSLLIVQPPNITFQNQTNISYVFYLKLPSAPLTCSLKYIRPIYIHKGKFLFHFLNSYKYLKKLYTSWFKPFINC